MHTALYDRLSVSPVASKQQIKKAYRKKAKEVHPDTGGDEEKFDKVNRAYLILIDDESRKKYDATGDESLKSADNEQSRIMQIIAGCMEAAITQLEQRRQDPCEHDLIAMMKSILKGEIQKLEDRVASCNVLIKKTEKLLGKFKVKKGNNFLEQMLLAKIENIGLNIKTAQSEMEPLKKAFEQLSDISFSFTPKSSQDTMNYTSAMEALIRGF